MGEVSGGRVLACIDSVPQSYLTGIGSGAPSDLFPENPIPENFIAGWQIPGIE